MREESSKRVGEINNTAGSQSTVRQRISLSRQVAAWLGLLVWLVAGAVWIVSAGAGVDFTIGVGRQPEVGTDEVGNTIVVWDDEGLIRGQGFDSAGNPGADFTIQGSGLTAGSLTNPDVSYMPGGDFVVAWERQDGTSSRIASQSFSGNGRPVGIEFGVTSPGSLPVTGSDEQGRLILAWSEAIGLGHHRYKAQRFNSNGRPVGIELSIGTGPEQKPALSVNPNGDFMLVWADTNQQIQGQIFDSDGIAYGPAFRVNKRPRGEHQLPAVTVGLDENFTVVWEGSVGASGKNRIFARRVMSRGRPVGIEFKVSGKLSHPDGAWPSVAADHQGHIVVAWRKQLEGGMDAIGARELNVNGRPVGIELTLRSTQNTSEPEISPAGDLGDFLVVWEGESDGAPEPEIFGRYLRVPLEDEEE